MFYREAGQFKTSYGNDQAVFPIIQDRWFIALVLIVAYAVVPFVADEYWLQAVIIPFLIFSLAAIGLNLLTGYAGQLSLGTGAFSFGEHVGNFVSAVSTARVRADGQQSFSNAQNTALKELELSAGVDTDAELQELLRIEQHYAANARVITTVDELMQTLLSI